MTNVAFKSAVLLGFLSVIGAMSVLAQTPGTPTYDSKFVPNSSGTNLSIGNIYSPNLFEGSANVTIPIYNFSNDYGSYGVSLTYNTKGVKVDQLSSKAGLQWNIKAGGSITRTVKDIPDELDAVHWAPANGPGFTLWNSKGRLALYALNGAIPPNTQEDGENDDFMVSFPGLNFTFNLGKDGYVFTHPHRRAKVTFSSSSVNMTFTITDEQGVVYLFEPGDSRKGFIRNHSTTTDSRLLEYDYISRWVIKEVTFPNGNRIKYNNEIADLPETLIYRRQDAKLSVPNQNSTNTGPLQYVKLNENVNEVSELTSIEYPGGTKVSFVPEPAQGGCISPLKDISVIAPDNNCLKYRLNKKFLVSKDANSPLLEIPYTQSCDYNSEPNLRMILKSIDILSCDESISTPYYTFDYLGEKLPSRLSNAQDVFGYYNGTPSIGIAITHPQYTWYGNSYGTDRSVSNTSAFLAAGNLVKVSNAYGGSINFEYEVHSGLTTVKTDIPIDPLFLAKGYNDGLRIKSITEKDKFHPGNAKVTNVQYSGGQRFLDGGYFHYLSDVGAGNVPIDYVMGSFFVSPHQLINGSNHGYSNVSVETKDQSGNLLGRTETRFSNFKDGTLLREQLNVSTKQYFHEPFTDKQYIRDWEIGLPIEVKTYDQNNLLLSKTTNEYTFQTDLSSAAPLGTNKKTMRARNGTINPFQTPVIAEDNYLPYTGKSLLTKTTTENYVNSSTAVVNISDYEYDNRDNIKSTISRNSKGQLIKTNLIYNYDVSGLNLSYGNHPGTFLYDWTNAGVEKVVSSEKWILPPVGSPASDQKLLNATIQVYGKDAQNHIYSKSVQVLAHRDLLTYQQFTGIPWGSTQNPYGNILTAYNTNNVATRFRRTSEVTKTDEMSNPLETRLQNLEQYKAMIWDEHGNKLADVVNARYTDIAYNGFESNATGNLIYNPAHIAFVTSPSVQGSIAGAKALKALNGASDIIKTNSLTPGKEYMITFWLNGGSPTCSGGGIGTVPMGITSEKGNWRFYQAKFIPTTTAPFALTCNGASVGYSFIDEVRIFPTDAMMQTFTYSGNTGVVASSDASGRLSYFEFDKLGRPTITRDQEGNILSNVQYYVNQ